MKKTFVKGFDLSVQTDMFNAQNGYCKHKGCHMAIHSFHHKLINSVGNRKRFPLYLDSPMNAVGLCNTHHTENAHEHRINENEAIIYEAYLNKLKGGCCDGSGACR